MSGLLKYLQIAFLVISSFVGPSPPVVITRFALCRARAIASVMGSTSSPTVVRQTTCAPAAVTLSDMKAALVSMVCPYKSSSPIVIISAFV